MRQVLALTRFKLAAYLWSHRFLQPFLGLLVVLVLLYSTRVPAGEELAAYTDSAALLTAVFGWTARSLLDTEPDVQRLVSAVTAGGPRREVAAGLTAAGVAGLALTAVALAVPPVIGFAALPSGTALLAGALLHLLGLCAGIALGALTSRPILSSPAVSVLCLIGGYLAMLLLSLSPLAWLTPVPVLEWMRAAGDGALTAGLPAFTVQALGWSGLAIAVYLRLRLRSGRS